MEKNKLLLIACLVIFLNLGFVVFGKIFIEKVTDRVIDKLKKDYSPSPYGPGFDPDKVSVIKNTNFSKLSINDKNPRLSSWRDEWEADRGFSP